MAVLSTIFGRGTKASRPAAGTAGAHYFATDEGILYRDSGSAWAAVSVVGLVYAFSTTTTDADPGAGTLRFNNATPASVTVLYVDDSPLNSGADLGTVFDALTGARVLITQADDPAKYLLGEVTADTDGTGYWKLTVTVAGSGTLPDDGALLSFVVLGGGGGSASTTPWQHDLAKANVISYCQFHDGDIVQNLGQLATIMAGTTDGDGQTGDGTNTETVVACSVFFDTTPAAAAGRGVTVFAQAVRADCGHYCKVYARFPTQADSHFTVGFHPGNTDDNPDTRVTDGGAYFYKKDTGANWFAASADGTAIETTDTGVAWATGDWHCFEIFVYDDGGTMTAKFWIDGALVATHTTRAPQAATVLGQLACRTHLKTGGSTVGNTVSVFCPGLLWVAYDQGVLAALGTATLPTPA
jgi:hypothetical protein